MIAQPEDKNDLAIHWSKGDKRIAKILQSGRCPSYSVPKRIPLGGIVALVATSGDVLLLFQLARIEQTVNVTVADGQRRQNGYYLVAKRGTIRRPRGRDPRVLNVNRHALGAFAYFDHSTFKRVIYELGNGTDPADASAAPVHKPFPSRRVPFFANNIGKTLSQPEKRLIMAYVEWIGDVTMFVHHPLKESGLYTDLFVPRCWTLFEAKSSIARGILREAVGQLFDYQRHYDRSPRLAVLLPERPASNVIGLFEKKRIVVVWRSVSGSFRDSLDGVLTKDLREAARAKKATPFSPPSNPTP